MTQPVERPTVEADVERVWRTIEGGNADPRKEIELAILAEREACAKVAEEYDGISAEDIAADIRQRPA